MVGYVTLEDLAFLSKTALDTPLRTRWSYSHHLSSARSEPVMIVIEKMIEGNEDHCFVVDAEGKLTGIISTIDVTHLLDAVLHAALRLGLPLQDP